MSNFNSITEQERNRTTTSNFERIIQEQLHDENTGNMLLPNDLGHTDICVAEYDRTTQDEYEWLRSDYNTPRNNIEDDFQLSTSSGTTTTPNVPFVISTLDYNSYIDTFGSNYYKCMFCGCHIAASFDFICKQCADKLKNDDAELKDNISDICDRYILENVKTTELELRLNILGKSLQIKEIIDDYNLYVIDNELCFRYYVCGKNNSISICKKRVKHDDIIPMEMFELE